MSTKPETTETVQDVSKKPEAKPAAKTVEQKKPSKETAKKPATKKSDASAKQVPSPKPEPSPKSPNPIHEKAQQAGEQLVATLDKVAKSAPSIDTAAGKKLAVKLSKATATNQELGALRDEINAVSSALREAKERDLAGTLSDLNRSVRTAERATRGAK